MKVFYCPDCGAVRGPDGYCTSCGSTKIPNVRQGVGEGAVAVEGEGEPEVAE